MKWQLDVSAYLCEPDNFQINGVPADYEDFGKKEDIRKDIAEPYGCGNMVFAPREPEPSVLRKYGIDEDEYRIVCEALEEKLSFGRCGWCI